MLCRHSHGFRWHSSSNLSLFFLFITSFFFLFVSNMCWYYLHLQAYKSIHVIVCLCIFKCFLTYSCSNTHKTAKIGYIISIIKMQRINKNKFTDFKTRKKNFFLVIESDYIRERAIKEFWWCDLEFGAELAYSGQNIRLKYISTSVCFIFFAFATTLFIFSSERPHSSGYMHALLACCEL